MISDIITIFCILGVIFCIFMMYRSTLTLNYSHYWIKEICSYIKYCIYNNINSSISYNDIMNYYKYCWRLFDFDKDNLIIDKEKLNILKNFKNVNI
jgi:hypothetical protein